MVSVRFASYTRPPRARRNPKVGSGFQPAGAVQAPRVPADWQGPNAAQKHGGRPEGLAAHEPISRTGNMRL
jgi:hypothetical protein